MMISSTIAIQFVITVSQFLAGMSIIVGLHELGHLLFAKLFKMRVNSYIIGFPPKLFKIKWGETEYAIGAIPLGGAVQIAGMIDESLDSNHLPAQIWEFRSKPAWQRLIVIWGGIIFNLISATLIYIGMTLVYAPYLPKDEVNKYGVLPNKVAMQMGFQVGDKIIKINGKNFEDFEDVYTVLSRPKSYYTIERKGAIVHLPILEEMVTSDLSDQKAKTFLRPIFPCLIKEVVRGSSAYKAGLMAGDQIIALSNQSILHIEQLTQAIPFCAGIPTEIVYLREGHRLSTTITIDPHEQKLGITMAQPFQYKKVPLIKAVAIGVKIVITMVTNCLGSIWKLVTGKLAIKESLGSPIAMARAFGPTFIWFNFLSLLAHFSVGLGVLNALPIPALDGGHSLFILYEWVFGRKPCDKFLQIMQVIGMTILLGIMLYTFGNDIRKLLS